MEQFLNLFECHSPNQVAMFAKLFSAFLAIIIAINFKDQFNYYISQPHRIYGKPIKLFGQIQLPQVTKNVFLFSGYMLMLSLACIASGVSPRFFSLVALFCYFPYFNPITSLAYIQRKTNLMPLVLLILTVSSFTGQPLNSQSTLWELTLIKIGIAQLYFSAGVQKLHRSGVAWCDGRVLQAYVLDNYLWSDRKIGYKLARNVKLCAFVSIVSLVFELSFWIIIFIPQLTYLYIAIALLFHVGTLLTMRINYLKYLSPVYMVFFTELAFSVKDYLQI